MEVLKWNLVSKNKIRNESGIYAWYYSVSIGDYDVNKLIDNLNSETCTVKKYKYVKDFLEKNLFTYFQEEKYQARIHGKLMPEFKGELQHVSQVSDMLINKIIDEPKILLELQNVINLLTIEFSSPIYIGMSNNLQVRVNKHKQLIEDFKSLRCTRKDFEDRDEDFAARVVSRGMVETKLKVALMYVSSDENLHNIMENILNRINYPILGRN